MLFLLLLKIVYNTRRDDLFAIPDVEIGEALISPNIAGLSVQEFRTAKGKLSKWGFASFKPTPKETIAKLTTDKFFKI